MDHQGSPGTLKLILIFKKEREKCAQRAKNNKHGLLGIKELYVENVNIKKIWVTHVQEFFVLFLQLFCKSEIVVKIKKPYISTRTAKIPNTTTLCSSKMLTFILVGM